ncbi:MAG: lysophospholipid acyltransferase family protein [Arcobacter sp.]|uniref:1-acyl-sn-glycerol-3-phosphate acyltransferase n=1 Tax=Arcobacter defluvii TaxID=873191 RepID=A0AAE7BDK3_9BACT|nr:MULTISPECIES: lysophospholipid acyltransferase family protein [Arcobacter]MDY3199625.1 lysophospholipid acyltransferase family protein [Arcobacter sp.]QKF77143.1 lysophospholipid acyltransferase [Arcobacter defluvii]RXI33565.1 1-acyl-sn-glycerol-3-phosphate acyltransferase [Arcobacter defluvii]BAK73040.1 1-acyl-glycerol-3-phosphate acyltransferase [Arcobacter sp. L]
MNLKQISIAIYATYLTNKFGFKLKRAKTSQEKRKLRLEYSQILLSKLNINIKVLNEENLPKEGQYLLVANHRSIIDPLIIEIALKDSPIHGFWVSKKELYNSFFFGSFTKNADSILLDRESANMSSFFKDTKKVIQEGNSIFIFPEGTRNKTDNQISSFKEGAKLIALKNKINILPVYIKTHANEVLKEAINKRSKNLNIEIEIGEIIDYKDKTSLEESYKKQFHIN